MNERQNSPGERSGAADRTRERLELLVRAGEMFHQSLDLDDTLYNVARVAVESFADLCLFDLVDEKSDRLYVTAGAHRDTSVEATLKNSGSSILYDSDYRVHPAVRVTQTGVPFFVPVFDDEQIARHAASAAHAAFMRSMNYGSKIIVPVVLQSRIYGALSFIRTQGGEPFDRRDVQFAEELGRRAGLAVANAKQYHREQHTATMLQESFLTQEFPNRPGLAFNALYRPSGDVARLGGDWYDAFTTHDGSTVVTIGDISGKGIDAARLMVGVRQSIRVAATVTRDPAEILRIVNDVMFLDHSDSLATTFIGVLDRELDALSYASAGHPPVFLRRNDRSIEALRSGSPPLGIWPQATFVREKVSLADAALLVMYTDGLSEVARDPIAGEQMILQLLAAEAALHVNNPARYFERMLGSNEQQDDIAIMTVRFGPTDDRQWRFDVGDTAVAYAIQRELIVSLGVTDEAQLNTCELILSELIGNAVRHAPGPLSLSISIDDGGVCLHAIDEGPGFEFRSSLPTDLWAESGRGLFLIAALARSVTAEKLPGCGSYIRVCLPLAAERSPNQPAVLQA